ncbi:MAG TPA: AbrB/MazE/SpoVT family DNA-binding domain-containing protein [Thermomicrobiales bacterium]|nr:AbrB/MazE/SpoVT family DNA-binding domain-containing protein [Thermomicrobiales bacterium]
MNQTESRMTSKGQVTIPAEIRARLGLKPRDRVRFEVVDGAVLLRRAHSAILEGYGAVAPTQRPEDWAAVREAVEEAIADEARREG